MTRVHRLEHVHGFRTTNLADDDSVRAHAESVSNQLSDTNLALSLDVRWTGLEPNRVPLLELELSSIFDRDDPLLTWNVR